MKNWVVLCVRDWHHALRVASRGANLAAAAGQSDRAFHCGRQHRHQARIISERLSAAFGQQFIVENRAGAGGAIAAEFVAKSPADGYTLFLRR